MQGSACLEAALSLVGLVDRVIESPVNSNGGAKRLPDKMAALTDLDYLPLLIQMNIISVFLRRETHLLRNGTYTAELASTSDRCLLTSNITS